MNKQCCENYNGTLDITNSCIFCKTYIPQEPMEWESKCREILFDFWKKMKILGDPFRDELIEETIYRLYNQIKQAEERGYKEGQRDAKNGEVKLFKTLINQNNE